MRPAWVAAWSVLALAWILLIGYLLGVAREARLCEPKDNVVVRLAQPQGASEKGAIYLDYAAARQARDGLDTWLHRYGRCP